MPLRSLHYWGDEPFDPMAPDSSDRPANPATPPETQLFALRHAASFQLAVEPDIEHLANRADTIVAYSGPGWYSLIGPRPGRPYPHYVKGKPATVSRIRITTKKGD
jgi:hypothetical protein